MYVYIVILLYYVYFAWNNTLMDNYGLNGLKSIGVFFLEGHVGKKNEIIIEWLEI